MTDRAQTSSVVPPRVLGIELPPFDPLNARAAVLRAAGHHVISLGQALPFFPPPPAALDAARAALDRPEVNSYSTDPGLVSLRAILAERLSTVSANAIGVTDLVITAGANHAFTLALNTVMDPGDEVVLPAPYFTNHQMVVVALGGTPIEAPVADRATFAVTWDDIAPHLSGRTKCVVLCNPSNPTGAPLTAPNGCRVVEECAARGIVVISDETYMHFVYEGTHWSAASMPHWRQNVIVIGTCSKSFGMMGWRVGFMLADASICAEAVKIQDATIICAPRISQMAAEGAIRKEWHYATGFHAEMKRRREIVRDALGSIPALEWTPTPAGLFAFVRVDGCTDSASLARDLLESAHVVTIPGAAFGASGEGYLRLSYGFATPTDLADALTRLRRYFAVR